MREATRYRLGKKSNILDLVLTRQEEGDLNLCLEAPLGKSDHAIVSVQLTAEVAPVACTKTVKRSYNRADYGGMRSELAGVDWQGMLSPAATDINKQYSLFLETYNSLVDKYSPIIKPRNMEVNKGKRGKYNKEIARAVRRKHRLWQR